MTIDTTDHERDAAYRHALAEYHASLRENFIDFLWTRPAYESYTPERNGGRSATRSKPPAPEVVTTSPTPAAGKKERSPLLETSRNVVNPLTGRRWVDSRTVTPRHGKTATPKHDGKGYVAPPMERSVPVPPPSIPAVVKNAPPPPPRQHTLPVRPLVKRHGTSSSSFGIRGRVHGPSVFPEDKGLGGGWKAMGNRSFHGFRRRSSSVSSASSNDNHSSDEDDDHHTPPALSHRSSSSSLAITSPTAPAHRTKHDEPTISNVPRHSIDDHSSPSPPTHVGKAHLRLPAVPAVSPFGELVGGMKRVGMGTPGTARTEGTEASWAALAPSPL